MTILWYNPTTSVASWWAGCATCPLRKLIRENLETKERKERKKNIERKKEIKKEERKKERDEGKKEKREGPIKNEQKNLPKGFTDLGRW